MRIFFTQNARTQTIDFYFCRNIETLPIFKRQLKDVRCCDGDSVRLECTVEAVPEPTVIHSVVAYLFYLFLRAFVLSANAIRLIPFHSVNIAVACFLYKLKTFLLLVYSLQNP